MIKFLFQYMYINPATLKKFIELIKNKKVDEKSVSLPIKPMYKVVYLNPQVTVGITGLRHIQKAGGLSTWPVIYMKKEHVSKNDSEKLSTFKPHLFLVQREQPTIFDQNYENPGAVERIGRNNKGVYGIVFWH